MASTAKQCISGFQRLRVTIYEAHDSALRDADVLMQAHRSTRFCGRFNHFTGNAVQSSLARIASSAWKLHASHTSSSFYDPI